MREFEQREKEAEPVKTGQGEGEGQMEGIEATSFSDPQLSAPFQIQPQQQMAGANTVVVPESQAQEASFGVDPVNSAGTSSSLPLRLAAEAAGNALATEPQALEVSREAETENGAGASIAPPVHQSNDEDPEETSLLNQVYGEDFNPEDIIDERYE